MCLALLGCDGTGPGGGLLRFGQSGELNVVIETPLHLGLGRLRQEISWQSDGAWSIYEQIAYQGAQGEEDLGRNPGLPLLYAASYATVIQQLNDNPGVKLTEVDELPQTECGADRSRVSLRIVDTRREERRTWVRCAFGTLASVTASGSGPDAEAARVIEVAIRVRDNTVGEDFRSTYHGSLPFATIEKGTETGWPESSPLVFRADEEGADGAEAVQEAWTTFWRTHRAAPTAAAPTVDWESEMVLAGLIGVREEVGDSAEIRSVISVADGTRIDLIERIPGDFCAPALQIVRPFHIVVAPRAPAPVYFADLKRELVPCGTS